jgi:hypothetical protein
MHFAHELVEVQTCFIFDWDRVVKAVHQETLATTHAAKHVNASRQFWLLL